MAIGGAGYQQTIFNQISQGLKNSTTSTISGKTKKGPGILPVSSAINAAITPATPAAPTQQINSNPVTESVTSPAPATPVDATLQPTPIAAPSPALISIGSQPKPQSKIGLDMALAANRALKRGGIANLVPPITFLSSGNSLFMPSLMGS